MLRASYNASHCASKNWINGVRVFEHRIDKRFPLKHVVVSQFTF